MVEKIRQLEKIARRLEPSSSVRKHLQDNVLSYAEDFLNQIETLPAYVVTDDKGIGIYDSPISETPIPIEEAITLLGYNIDRPGLNPASGGHLGYIPGGGVYMSALGDYLADVMNRYAGVNFGGPGAVHLENMLIEWMAGLMGYPKDCGGNLTSGGSIANLIGIVAARDAFQLKAKDIDRSVIYLTEQVHHSVDKAIRIAGLKECILRYIPIDTNYRMNANALNTAITNDTKNGLNPWLVIASAGTTDTGAVDPLSDISEITRAHNLWFHVDGAYGAFFVLCNDGKKILKGMDQSDSLVMDPHKGLFLPYGTGCALVRDKQKLYDAFWYQANYLQDALNASDERSPADLSPELTKHFRGLRLWLPLKLLGVAPFRAAIEEKMMLARYFHEQIQNISGFEAGNYPDLSVVTYRYVPDKGDADEFNAKLIKEVQNDGRVFLSSTTLDGKFILRLAVLSFRTHLDTINMTLEILKNKSQLLEKSI